MRLSDLDTPKDTLEILKKYHFVCQKRYGQNFLINGRALDKMVFSSGIAKNDLVLEIGPGIGTLTQRLAEEARKVIAVEIDRNLIPILKETLSGYGNVKVLNEDILKTDIEVLAEKENGGRPIKVAANLPYYLTTPLIIKLLKEKTPVKNVTVMVQKEVARRMQALPGTKEYGALSLAVQYRAKVRVAANVSPNCFLPRPKVGSAIVCLDVYQTPQIAVQDPELMKKIIRASFMQRRKTLTNALRNSPDLPFSKEEIEESVKTLGKGAAVRGETLSLKEFAFLSDMLKKKLAE